MKQRTDGKKKKFIYRFNQLKEKKYRFGKSAKCFKISKQEWFVCLFVCFLLYFVFYNNNNNNSNNNSNNNK